MPMLSEDVPACLTSSVYSKSKEDLSEFLYRAAQSQHIWLYNPTYIFAHTRLVYTRHVTEHAPAKTGQYPSVIMWLAPWAGKMTQIARCDWLLERKDGAILPARDYPLYPERKISRKAT